MFVLVYKVLLLCQLLGFISKANIAMSKISLYKAAIFNLAAILNFRTETEMVPNVQLVTFYHVFTSRCVCFRRNAPSNLRSVGLSDPT